jgi:hypothetical protein
MKFQRGGQKPIQWRWGQITRSHHDSYQPQYQVLPAMVEMLTGLFLLFKN